jgi:hypothetical protein
LHATRRRHPSSLALFAALALVACKGGADARATAAGEPGVPATERAVMEAAGPVVIAAPSGRYVGGTVGAAGSVSGTAGLTTPLTPEAALSTGRDSSACGASVPDSSVQVKGTGLGNVVVWLDGVRKGKPVSLEKRIELESDHCLLTPRVQGAFLGGAVNVIAHDEFRQHLRFIAGGEKQPRAAVLLGKDEQVIPSELPLKTPGLVIIRDLDHSWPRAFIAVFDHPYFAVTKPDGTWSIDQVPPGTYTLVAWHERTGRSEQQVTITANSATKVDLKLEGK